MSSIVANLALVERLIKQACQAASRPRSDITLVAVSKGHNFSALQAAYDAGVRHFGESYAQEMAQKMMLAQEHGLRDITWHFIGAIQSNKLKTIIQAQLIHSLASLKHAALLNQATQKPIEVLLQINLDQNPQRQGFLAHEIVDAAKQISKLPHITLKGLMCIPPQDPHHPPSFWFRTVNVLKDTLAQQGFTNIQLSMGMSEDFIEAITLGANYVRIGSKIFGERI